jgi:hypothetical protein
MATLDSQLAMLRHLAKAGQELFRDDDDYESYLGILRALAAEGWVDLQTWPPAGRMGPQRRRRFAVVRILPAGRLALSAIDRGELPERYVEHSGRLDEAP